jgi:hypothetical protein
MSNKPCSATVGGMKIVLALTLLSVPLAAQRKPGSQLDHLPPHMEILTWFGERAETAKTTNPAGVGYGIVLYWFK